MLKICSFLLLLATKWHLKFLVKFPPHQVFLNSIRSFGVDLTFTFHIPAPMLSLFTQNALSANSRFCIAEVRCITRHYYKAQGKMCPNALCVCCVLLSPTSNTYRLVMIIKVYYSTSPTCISYLLYNYDVWIMVFNISFSMAYWWN